MKKILIAGLVIICSILFSACNKFMDIVPDNVPRLENAFAMRTMAERYLFTCYSWMPAGFDNQSNTAMLAGDEAWLNSTANYQEGTYGNWYIARGGQGSNKPLNNYWEGTQQGKNLWAGIRDCNVFLENIYNVPDMDSSEIKKWAAEVTFLKAYYHYFLLKMYGPVHIMDKNIEAFSDSEATQIERKPVDECIRYIVGLIDASIEDLPDDITGSVLENGRITKLVAYSMKAEILVTAASPLFNGNKDYPGFVNQQNVPFFNPVYSAEKWAAAKNACEVAVNFSEEHGRRLFKWTPPFTMNPAPQQTTKNQMNYREAVAEREGNTEQIWVNNANSANSVFQRSVTVRSYDPALVNNTILGGFISPTINVALLFYSKNGVPIEEDKNYDYSARFALRTVPAGTSAYMYNLTPGYTTIGLHFDREDRFYAALSFDGGRYFMSSHTDDSKTFSTSYRVGGNCQPANPSGYSITGYTPKKLVSYRNVYAASNVYTVYDYAYPILRLADLYLLYSEALNETGASTTEVCKYVDLVRERSGLKGIVDSWNSFSKNPGKPKTKEGLREIILRERSIELMFEGKRFWDLLRTKTALQALNTNILGWNVREKDPELFYRPTNLFSRKFTQRDYLWPLSLNELRRNSKLTQNPGW
ncbi:MAG: RagB/SusD family nutrient uptake outer membrane protein [Candidatus Pedobacter colombiensis]|uniref:RagB/SusD family nutrient uptake outer membrane protein n=1 Tax=Candidatus Pedobacter colombiensis TaxID=3121371 RepID=A0AAJ6B4H6_9SPHI|nr:RagB/SusD family nutrient uptake outer membrane protein [Pedobacter sp.]WEK17642.1 MAG: RagB/SusD family nutrient uptake outer membrane protein [Pedobacter sp.]